MADLIHILTPQYGINASSIRRCYRDYVRDLEPVRGRAQHFVIEVEGDDVWNARDLPEFEDQLRTEAFGWPGLKLEGQLGRCQGILFVLKLDKERRDKRLAQAVTDIELRRRLNRNVESSLDHFVQTVGWPPIPEHNLGLYRKLLANRGPGTGEYVTAEMIRQARVHDLLACQRCGDASLRIQFGGLWRCGACHASTEPGKDRVEMKLKPMDGRRNWHDPLYPISDLVGKGSTHAVQDTLSWCTQAVLNSYLDATRPPPMSSKFKPGQVIKFRRYNPFGKVPHPEVLPGMGIDVGAPEGDKAGVHFFTAVPAMGPGALDTMKRISDNAEVRRQQHFAQSAAWEAGTTIERVSAALSRYSRTPAFKSLPTSRKEA